MKDGTRFSVQRAYVYPASRRPNLTIRPYSTATKVKNFKITISSTNEYIWLCVPDWIWWLKSCNWCPLRDSQGWWLSCQAICSCQQGNYFEVIILEDFHVIIHYVLNALRRRDLLISITISWRSEKQKEHY